MGRWKRWLAYALAQARVPLGLAAAYDRAIPGMAAQAFAGKPLLEEGSVGGVPATVFRPRRGRGPWPAALVIPGVTRLGRNHAGFVALGRGLASSGHLVVVVEPEGLTVGELTPATVLQTRAAAEATASRSDARAGRVALLGVSGGGTLALRVAAAPELAQRLTAVATLAPCCDITETMRLVTTGVYKRDGVLVPFATGDFLKLVMARSVVAWLPEGSDRTTLRSFLLSLDDYAPDPLSKFRTWPRDTLAPPARAAVDLLANRDPERFDELFAELPEALREGAQALSPGPVARRIAAPVELVVAREDKYLPLADAVSFGNACRDARLTVIESLAHAMPGFSLGDAGDVARLDGVLVRLLAAMRSPAYSRQ